LVAVLVIASALPIVARAQTAATVNGQAIDAADVERKLRATYGSLDRISKELLPRFQARALDQLIDQQLVLSALAREKGGVGEDEVQLAIDDFKKRLERDKLTFAEFLKGKGHDDASWRRDVAWQLNWKRYTARHITDKAQEEYFQKHRRELDGTELRVSHILLKADGAAGLEKTQALLDQAADIRAEIVAGKLKFEDAVTKHSAGTKKDGGDLGYIRRQGSMPEAFSRAAFKLNEGELSPPIASPFGVHLIRCTSVKAGKKTLADDAVRQRVQLLMAQQLFETLAARERKTAKIEFSGKAPYLKPGSEELVVP
jgi:parvulin-like peptidyl-prolyl isomerase